jgi:hypothetical protein
VGEDRSTTRRRVTVAEAAGELGLTVEAVRGRIKRNTLAHEKGEDGTVYVLLDTDQPQPVADQPPDRRTDQALLITRLENEVQFLREELARKDAIMLNMTETLKALSPPVQEAPSEPPESPTAATPQPGRVEPQTTIEAADEAERAGRATSHESAMGGGSLHSSWWRRMFRG